MLKFGFAAYVVAATLLLAPEVSADDCTATDTVTVCEHPGDASVSAVPPTVAGGEQNGSYGPNGDTPPLGRD